MGILLFLLGILAVIASIPLMIRAALRRSRVKPFVYLLLGGIAAFFLGVFLTPTTPKEPQEIEPSTTSISQRTLEAEPESKSEPEPAPESEPAPTPAPSRSLKPESVAEPEAVSETEPAPEPESGPVSETEPAPEPEPTPQPEPAPAVKAIHGVPADTVVYVSKRSHTIHKVHDCSGMKNYEEMTIEQAEAKGYDYCPNCW